MRDVVQKARLLRLAIHQAVGMGCLMRAGTAFQESGSYSRPNIPLAVGLNDSDKCALIEYVKTF
jgi:hypothetical protein